MKSRTRKPPGQLVDVNVYVGYRPITKEKTKQIHYDRNSFILTYNM